MSGAHVGGRHALAIRAPWLAAYGGGSGRRDWRAYCPLAGTVARLVHRLPAVAAVTDHYLRVVGPFYGFFGLGLCLYFASQGLNSLFWPVFGTFLRLAVVAAGIGQ